MAARGLRLSCQLQRLATGNFLGGIKSRNCILFNRKYHCLSNGTQSESFPCKQSVLKNVAQLSPNCAISIISEGNIRNYSVSAFDSDDEGPQKNEDAVLGAFDKFDISQTTQNKLRAKGISHLFPVQYHTFMPTINGIDVVVQARTGTGKTLSFALPIVEKLQRNPNRLSAHGRRPRVVVLAPTRELANQVKEDIVDLCAQVRVVCVFGGESYERQVSAIRQGIDVVVGTPGRMKDLIDQGRLSLQEVEHVILDEVDQMLDMGFSDQVEDIIYSNYKSGIRPQTMMYSATMPDWVKRTSRKYLSEDHQTINLVGKQAEQTATTIKQYSMQCRESEHATLIKDLIKIYSDGGRVIIFCQTKREADMLSSQQFGEDSRALHGDISQSSRSMIMKGFKDQTFNILITTDVAARGLDIPDVNLVIQTQPPNDNSKYIHRVGRTGRAGKTGMSILMYQEQERRQMQECEMTANTRFQDLPKPTIDQLYESWSKEASRQLDKVPCGITTHFHAAAETLMKDMGPLEAMSSALAIISGADKYVNRSLITMKPGMTTLCYKSDSLSPSDHVFKKIINNYLVARNTHARSVKMLKARNGAVFDIPNEDVDFMLKEFDNLKQHDGESMEKVLYLPPVYEYPDHRRDSHSFSRHSSRAGSSFRRKDRSYNRVQRSMYDDDDVHDGDDFYNRDSDSYKKMGGFIKKHTNSYNSGQNWRDNNDGYHKKYSRDFDDDRYDSKPQSGYRRNNSYSHGKPKSGFYDDDDF